MGTSDKKQEAEAERALQRGRVDALMEQGVSFADPARVDIRGTLTCGKLADLIVLPFFLRLAQPLLRQG